MDISKNSNKHHKRIKIAGILLAVLLVLYILLVNVLISAALVPSFMRKLDSFSRITEQSYAEQVQTQDVKDNYKSLWNETKEWFQGVEKKKLETMSEDGYQLIAVEFIPGGYEAQESLTAGEEIADPGKPVDSHRWVLLLHGYTGWKEEMYVFARWYEQMGFHVLVPDMRCQGESEGDFIGMGYTDSKDNMLWIDYILKQDPEAEIVLHGQSMGAAAALMMTGLRTEEYKEELSHVTAVISDCAYTDAYSMFGDKITEWFYLPPFPLVDSACLMLKLRGGYDLRKASAVEAVKHSRIPTLFIHGKEDAMIDVSMAYALYEAATCKKELLIVEGAGHAQAQDKDPDAYFGAIEDFLSL